MEKVCVSFIACLLQTHEGKEGMSLQSWPAWTTKIQDFVFPWIGLHVKHEIQTKWREKNSLNWNLQFPLKQGESNYTPPHSQKCRQERQHLFQSKLHWLSYCRVYSFVLQWWPFQTNTLGLKIAIKMVRLFLEKGVHVLFYWSSKTYLTKVNDFGSNLTLCN